MDRFVFVIMHKKWLRFIFKKAELSNDLEKNKNKFLVVSFLSLFV